MTSEKSRHKRPTMADVGRLAGVSGATVSFVLNENSGQAISAETRRRVMEAVERLNYRPNRMARGLRTRHTATIGFVTDEIATHPSAGATILGAHEAAWSQGHLLTIVNTTRDKRIVGDVIDELIDRDVDGIIFAVVGTRRLTLPETLKGVPAVVVNGYVTRGVHPTVLPDEVRGGREASQVLVDAGHRRIAYLTGHEFGWATRARTRGFVQTMTAAGIPERDRIVLEGNFRIDSGYDLTKRLLKRRRPPTAIMCGNDLMAVGAYLALAEAGVRVPTDMSVMGYDDQPQIACDLRPELSTVRLPYYQMGRWAVDRLLAPDLAETPMRTHVHCPLVLRASVGAPAGE
jgi:LacI family transcriptional regulator